MTEVQLSVQSQRRHDLDALRAFAMLLGIALHGAIPYAPGFPWAIQDSQSSPVFTWMFMIIHGFRMPLFFLIRDRKSTRLNSSHSQQSRMPSSA